MKVLSLVSILLAVIGWILMIMMGTNLLSGPLEERTCGTACVQTFFFSGVAVAVFGVAVSVLSMKGSGANALNAIGMLASLAICGIAGVLFIAGNFF